jgi:hypothetical protein
MNTYWLERHLHAVECSKITRCPAASIAYEQLAAHYLSMYHWLERRVGSPECRMAGSGLAGR